MPPTSILSASREDNGVISGDEHVSDLKTKLGINICFSVVNINI